MAGDAVRAILLAAFVFVGTAAAAPNQPFTGRWRMDTASLKGNIKPTVIRLADGTFSRDDNPPVAADGRLHPVSGSNYVDEMSIAVDGDHVVREVDKVHGKLAYTVDYTVSPDGRTLTWNVANYTSPTGEGVRSMTVQRRVGAPVAGAHIVSGTWERVSVAVGPKNDWVMRLDGKRFSWRTEAGTGYDAVIGGKAVRIDGDNAGSLALITRPRADTIVETDLSAKGEREAVMTMRLLPDGRTIRGTSTSLKRKLTQTFTLHKLAE